MAGGVLVNIAYDEMFQGSASLSELEYLTSAWPLESTLDLIGRLSALLRFGQLDYRAPKFQHQFVEALRLNCHRTRLDEFIDQGRTLFYPEQLAILIKQVVKHSRAAKRPQTFGDDFCRALLTISSLRSASIQRTHSGTPSDLVPTEIAGMFGFEDPYLNKLLVYASFFRWASTEEARGHPAFSDVNSDVVDLLEMSWVDFMAVGYGEILRFKQITSFENLSNYSYLLPPEYLNTIASPQAVEKWLRINTVDVAELSTLLDTAGSDSHLGATLFPLKQRPFIRLPSGNLCCPYIPFLENASTSGLYYRLADAYREKNPKRSNLLRTFFGHYLELHVLSLFSRVSKERHYAIDGDKTYRIGRVEYHGADVVVSDGRDVAFIEVTATRFREIESLIELRDEFIEEDIARLIEKIEELDEDIRHFREGHLEYEGVSPRSLHRLFPIIVTSFAVPHWVGIISQIREAIKRNSWLQNTETLEIIEVQALDLLEGDLSATISIFDLLTAKQSMTKTSPWSLMNFVALRGKEIGLGEPVAKPNALNEIEDELRKRYNSWGGMQIVKPPSGSPPTG
jgi:hypothetical protein